MSQAENKVSFLHRSRLDIIASILRVSVKGGKKTHIMYNCNLSYKQLQSYIELVSDMGLLRITPGNQYKTTPKGLSFLKSYQEIQTLLNT